MACCGMGNTYAKSKKAGGTTGTARTANKQGTVKRRRVTRGPWKRP